ncbi:MAG: hypothetical protein ACLFPL_03815 [Candidatus Nanoarchaeia archaeon]
MNITITDTLQKEKEEYSAEHEMFRAVIEEKTQFICHKLETQKQDVELILVNSKSKMSTFLITTQELPYPIAYKEGTNQIMTIHPKMTGQLFKHPQEEYKALIEYALLKMYLWNKYGQNEQSDYFYKHCSEIAAQILSNKYLSKIAEFEIKMYTRGKKISKREMELGVFFYLMREMSGIDFIYDHLDTIFEEKDPKTSLHTIYKKNFDDMILPLKEKLLEEQRREQELQKQARAEQRRQHMAMAKHNSHAQQNTSNNQQHQNRNTNQKSNIHQKQSHNKNNSNFKQKQNEKPSKEVDVDKL